MVPKVAQLPKHAQLKYGSVALLDPNKDIESMHRPSVQWMRCNNKSRKKAQRASKRASTHQWVAFWLMWLYETKIASIISTYANDKCDFKENKIKF